MSRINTKLFKEASLICDFHDAKISFGYTGDYSEVDVHSRSIVIDLKEVKCVDWFWSLVFHELAHIYCWDNGIYHTYHADNLPKKEMAKYMRKMALKVERYVDRLGEKLMREHGYENKFKYSYKSKESVQWLKNWIEKEYPM